MPKLDYNIYGLDENSMAQDISSDALRNTAGKEEFWSKGTFDQEARAKGNSPEREDYDAKATNTNKGKDSRADSKDNH
jgi:hypothetical protein